MVSFLYRKEEFIGGTRMELDELSARTCSFNAERRESFLSYQPFCMRTEKWYALYHLADMPERLGTFSLPIQVSTR